MSRDALSSYLLAMFRLRYACQYDNLRAFKVISHIFEILDLIRNASSPMFVCESSCITAVSNCEVFILYKYVWICCNVWPICWSLLSGSVITILEIVWSFISWIPSLIPFTALIRVESFLPICFKMSTCWFLSLELSSISGSSNVSCELLLED